MSIIEDLTLREELKNDFLKKAKDFEEVSISRDLTHEYERMGWKIVKSFKLKTRLRRDKSNEVYFHDKIWCLFYNLGFDYLTSKNGYDLKDNNSNIIDHYDLIAADNESILFIKCLYSDDIITGESYKSYIDDMIEIKANAQSQFLKDPEHRKMKYRFIIVLHNIVLTNTDINRLEELQIGYFDDDICDYYEKLVKNLGYSAKYQLLGFLFDGQKIPNLKSTIPAIQGKLGKHTYYSFSIEPEKLLKISYVLHRIKANSKSMPTYQRLIKRARINKIRTFVDSGGYFPNSVIININTNGHGLTFDLSSLQSENSISRIGLLHIPQKYRSAYIIDGQHRLYGYAESRFKNKNTIPVVAFIDLDRADQVRLFMEINENQKAVSKNLRNTLNSDLLWDSKFLKEQREAIRSNVSQNLGDDHDSPLYNRILIGENDKTPFRCITLDTVDSALKTCDYLSVFDKKNKLIKQGLLDYGDNQNVSDNLTKFLINNLSYIKANCHEEWQKSEKDNGFIISNNCIYALIKIFNDILIFVNAHECIDKKNMDEKIIAMKKYLDPLISKFNEFSDLEKDELKKSYGSGGKIKVWRTFECYIQNSIHEFAPEGLAKYLEDNAKTYNKESFEMIRDIECKIKEDVKSKLISKYGNDWFRKVPKKVYTEAIALAAEKDFEHQDEEIHDAWDCLNFIHYRDIVMQPGDWSDLFEKSYSYQEDDKSGGSKKQKTAWMEKISHIRNNNVHSYSVKKEEFEYLKKIHSWFLETNKVVS